jgi:asparagine synthase (glutamine-hydrolysing)
MTNLARLRHIVPGPLRAAVSKLGAVLPTGFRGRHHLIGLAGDIGHSIAHVNMYFDRTARRALVPTRLAAAGVTAESWRAGLSATEADPRDRAMRTDFASTMVDGYLVRVDRASMYSSLEVRAPFLDHRLIAFAMGRVPADLKVTRAERKILPRRLAERVLPSDFDRSRKQGFTMPLAAWFPHGWGEFFADALHAEPDLFDRAAVDRLIAGQHAGRANVERLFALTMLALWRREYRVAL